MVIPRAITFCGPATGTNDGGAATGGTAGGMAAMIVLIDIDS